MSLFNSPTDLFLCDSRLEVLIVGPRERRQLYRLSRHMLYFMSTLLLASLITSSMFCYSASHLLASMKADVMENFKADTLSSNLSSAIAINAIYAIAIKTDGGSNNSSNGGSNNSSNGSGSNSAVKFFTSILVTVAPESVGGGFAVFFFALSFSVIVCCQYVPFAGQFIWQILCTFLFAFISLYYNKPQNKDLMIMWSCILSSFASELFFYCLSPGFDVGVADGFLTLAMHIAFIQKDMRTGLAISIVFICCMILQSSKYLTSLREGMVLERIRRVENGETIVLIGQVDLENPRRPRRE